MRISVCNFVSVAKTQKSGGKKTTCDRQDSASEAHPPPSTHQLIQSARQGNRRNQAREAYPSNAESYKVILVSVS